VIYYIYALVDASSNTPFYVGHTIDVDRRVKVHAKARTRAGERFRSILASGSRVESRVLDTASSKRESFVKEHRCIVKLRRHLVNIVGHSEFSMEKTTNRLMRLPTPLVKRAEKAASSEGRSFSDYVVRAVEAALAS
jgi:hypothetical protein